MIMTGLQVWHDEVERWQATGHLDKKSCECKDCIIKRDARTVPPVEEKVKRAYQDYGAYEWPFVETYRDERTFTTKYRALSMWPPKPGVTKEVYFTITDEMLVSVPRDIVVHRVISLAKGAYLNSDHDTCAGLLTIAKALLK